MALEQVSAARTTAAGTRRASGSRPRWAPSTCATTARRASRHAVGRSYPDLVRIRSGDAASAPDAVRAARLGRAGGAPCSAACAEQRVAVVPVRRRHERGGRRGAGARRVGGGGLARPAAGSRRRSRWTATSLTARLDAGLLGPEAERRLREQGVTLGHFPQSFEYSTVGGWVATRSAGQASTGYGRIDELVEGVRCVTPAGELGTRAVPASAAGPSLRELVVGSEGVLGVICEATLRVRPAPGGAPLRGLVVRAASPRAARRSA